MTAKEQNDYFYVCALIEYIARETLNHRSDIVKVIVLSVDEKRNRISLSMKQVHNK